MKILKKVLIFVFVCAFLLLGVACGTDNGTDDTGGGTEKGGTINIFLPIDSDSETAFKNVGNAYKKM